MRQVERRRSGGNVNAAGGDDLMAPEEGRGDAAGVSKIGLKSPRQVERPRTGHNAARGGVRIE